MTALAEALSGPGPLLLDGGLGTMLIGRGLAAGRPPEEWVLARPHEVAAVHRAYVEAGSRAVHAATFGANPIRLDRYGLAAHAEEINAAAVRLARASGAEFVLADVGPTGEYLPPVGRAEPGAWREAYLAQARALLVTDADGIHLETFSDLREARVALEAILSLSPRVPVLASLTFDRKPRGFFTVMGDPLGPSLAALQAAGAAAVGANCTLASADMAVLADEALRTPVPLVVQPNAGQPRAVAGRFLYDQTPEQFASDLAPLLSAAAEPARGRLVALGGCCGTDPRFVAALRSLPAFPPGS